MRSFNVITQVNNSILIMGMVGVSYVFLCCGTSQAQDVFTSPMCVFVGSTPATTATVIDKGAELASRFHGLAAEWHAERSAALWVSDMAMCPAYQKIIGMGPVVVPLILAELESEGNEPDHWFWALRSITNLDPVPEESRGNIAKMAAAWLDWGRSQ